MGQLVPGRFRLGGEVVGPPAATVPLSCGKVEEGGELVPGRPEVNNEVGWLQLGHSATTGVSGISHQAAGGSRFDST